MKFARYPSLVVTIVLELVSASSIPPCPVTFGPKPYFQYFGTSKGLLETWGVEIKFQEEGVEGCSVDPMDIADRLKLSETGEQELVSRLIVFRCKGPTLLHILPYTGKKHMNAIMQVQVSGCISDVKGSLTLASIGNTKTFAIVFGSICKTFDNSTEVPHGLYRHMDTVASLGFINSGYGNGDILDLFNKSSEYLNLAELIIRNDSLSHVPEELSKLFPNLQSLEIANNKFSSLPNIFPWTNSTFALPDNLSRSDYGQNQYATSEYLEIPKHLFRRVLILDNNRLSNISNQTFNGFLHKISLINNGIAFLNNDTFLNVVGLQVLVLSNNKLTSLSPGLFRSLNALRKLDLSINFIQVINSDDFFFTTALLYLNMANNSLGNLSSGSFANLKQTETFRLENNLLTYLPANAFPVESIHLTELHFQNNPITSLPAFVFWIRKLKIANFKNTEIRFDNLTKYAIALLDYTTELGQSVIDSASDSDQSDLMVQSPNPRLIDVSYCHIDSLSLDEEYSPDYEYLLVLLLHFRFDLTGNPIMCDCKINNFVKYINFHIENHTIVDENALFSTWLCSKPMELNRTAILHVKEEQTYCPVVKSNCPSACACFERTNSANIIVDCRLRHLSEIDNTLPTAKLELWYSNNVISELTPNPAFRTTISLDVSYNKLQTIDETVIDEMKLLKYLNLKGNLLTLLPSNIQTLNLESASLSQNYYKCDCNSLWMKNWLLKTRNTIEDWDLVVCTTEHEEGHVFIDVNDDEFVCKKYDIQIRNIVVPAVVASTVTVVMIALCLLLYTFRLEVKVCLFIYFGIHPFDDDTGRTGIEDIDCVIVHSKLQTDWVMEKLVNLLESSNYNFLVCDMARDFVVGFSFQENLTKTVIHSKRMIFLISQDWKPIAESFGVAWGIAQEKIKETRSNFGIIITHGVKKHEIEDKDIRLFMKRGRYVDSDEKFFANKILYYMPVNRLGRGRNAESITDIQRPLELAASRYFLAQRRHSCSFDTTFPRFCDESVADVQDETVKYHSFISYGENDLDYTMNELVPIFEKRGLNYCLPDKDFVVGASKEENILNAITLSWNTIFIISPSHVFDEWSLFTFRAAYEKSLREKTNHLIVIIKDNTDIDADIQDEEMKHYVRNYICLHQTDKWFENKLLNSLMIHVHGKKQARLESDLTELSTGEIRQSPEADLEEIHVYTNL